MIILFTIFGVYFQKYLYKQYLQAFFQQVQKDKQLYKSRSPSPQDNTVRKLQQASQTRDNSWFLYWYKHTLPIWASQT